MLRGVFGSRHRPRQAAVGGAELTSTSISDERFSFVGAAAASAASASSDRNCPITELGFVVTIDAAATIEDSPTKSGPTPKDFIISNVASSAPKTVASGATLGG